MPYALTLDNLLSAPGVDSLRRCGATHFIHCAALAHRNQPRSHAALQHITRVNTQLPVRLARIAIESGVRRFVFISSAGVHGSSSLPSSSFNESSPIAPSNAYSNSKAEAERLLRSIFSNSSCELVILRPALVYGPMLIGNLRSLVSAVDCCIPFPFSAIRNRRSLVALSNLLSAIEHVSLHPSAAGQSYMVADREYISISALISFIAKARSRPCFQFPVPRLILSQIARIPFFDGKLNQLIGDLVIDSSKIRAELCWEQPVSQCDAMLEAFSARQ